MHLLQEGHELCPSSFPKWIACYLMNHLGYANKSHDITKEVKKLLICPANKTSYIPNKPRTTTITINMAVKARQLGTSAYLGEFHKCTEKHSFVNYDKKSLPCARVAISELYMPSTFQETQVVLGSCPSTGKEEIKIRMVNGVGNLLD